MASQLVNSSCSICHLRVSSVIDAIFCELCGAPVHRECIVSAATSEHCEKCGSLKDPTWCNPANIAAPTSAKAIKRRLFTRIEFVLLLAASLMFVGWTIALQAEAYVNAENRLAMSLISCGSAIAFSVINRRLRLRTGRRSWALFAATIVCGVSAILWGASAYFEHKLAAVRQHQFRQQSLQQFGL
jgi:hypothetical protein